MADKMQEVEEDAMETEDKSSDSDSSDSEDNADSSGNESEKDEQKEAELAALEKSLSQNPYAYDTHVAVIQLLQSMGELDRLRTARERMSKLFPLTDELWLSWLRDEIQLVTTPEERKHVNALFERAVQDYLSVEVWLEWGQFSMGVETTDEGIESVRSVMDRALTAAGLHVSKGAMLWEAYREYENIILNLQEAGSAPTEEQQQKKATQRGRVLALYRRQLACPLLDMQVTREELSEWATEEEQAPVEHGYQRALAKLKEITPFEDKLFQSEGDDLVAAYQSYLEYEKGKGEPARVQLLYERCLAQFALNGQLWLDYVTFVDCVLSIPHVAWPVCQRALRNVPWDSRLWVAALRAAERHGKEHLDVQGVLEQALAAGLTGPADWRSVWDAYLDYLRRRVPWEEKGEAREKRIKELRDCTNRAIEHLGEMFGAEGDLQCELAQAWARCEASHCGDMERARNIWGDILATEALHPTAAAWMEFINLERQYGDAKHLRKLYLRALTATKDWPETISQAWLAFEKDQGTLESFETALDKINAKMKKVAENRAREQEKQTSSKFQKMKLKRKREESPANPGEPRAKQQAWGHLQPKSQPVAKQAFVKQQDKGEAAKWNKSEPESFKKPKVPPPPGFKQEQCEEMPSAGTQRDESGMGSAAGKEHRTVFVSNLLFDTGDEDLRAAFSEVGTITDLRLVKDFKGRSKGYCYVELSSQEEAIAALKKDREKVNGRPMFVSKCDPDRQTRQKVFKYSTNMEKNKLFVKGLPLSMDEAAVRTLFEKYGTVKDVRLVTYRNGHSKGLAYVDFQDEAEAAHALIKTDGVELEGRILGVAISRPPERKVQQTSLLAPEVQSLGGKSRETVAATRPTGRGAASLMVPRNVRLALPTEMEVESPPASTSANGEQSAPQQTTAPQKPKSNADFRNLLLSGKK